MKYMIEESFIFNNHLRQSEWHAAGDAAGWGTAVQAAFDSRWGHWDLALT